MLRRQAAAFEAEPDSTTVLHDAMWMAFERGDFAAASRFAERLREHHSPDALGLGSLATVLAGQPLDPTAEDDEANSTPQALARALQAAANARFAEAAKTLRGIDHATSWHQLSWTPHPKPALVLPEKARPAVEKFLNDFTRAYRDAEHAKPGQSIDALADAFDALAP